MSRKKLNAVDQMERQLIDAYTRAISPKAEKVSELVLPPNLEQFKRMLDGYAALIRAEASLPAGVKL